MLLVKTRVRRGGETLEIPADQVVPGDIVLVEAGDASRRMDASSRRDCGIDESALTGPGAQTNRCRKR
jgi:Ca2+-transporting ATPase